MLSDILDLIQERNEIETTPFVSILESNASLLNQVDALQSACELAKQEITSLRDELHDAKQNSSSSSIVFQRSSSNVAFQAALKNETKLREKIEFLENELAQQVKLAAEESLEASRQSNEAAKLQKLLAESNATISRLEDENKKLSLSFDRISEQLRESVTDARLSEQQFEGLKTTIRTLQEENNILRKEKTNLETRFMSEKAKLINEMNGLNDVIENFRRHSDFQKSFYMNGSHSQSTILNPNPVSIEKNTETKKVQLLETDIPSTAKIFVSAHTNEGTCLVFDRTSKKRLVTAGGNSVKVWDVASCSVVRNFKGSLGHSIAVCDISGNTVIGAGSDRTCRVWNLRTERMIHQLVGHQHKITCLRLFSDEKAVVTGSADCSLKIWDISRSTYRQNISFQYPSIPNCVDINSDVSIVASGHMDGSLLLWDIRSEEKISEISGLHEHNICSIQIDKNSNNLILSTGGDASIKIFDLRKRATVQTFKHPENSALQSWATGILSPDNRFVISGSNMSGKLFVWDITEGSLHKTLQGHEAGIAGVDWTNVNSGYRLASLDRKGNLILWS